MPATACAVRSASASFSCLRGNVSVSSRSLKLRSRSMAMARGLQAVEGEVQLLAVRHRRQQVADGFRRVALGHEVAQRVEVAERLRHLLAFHQQKLGVQPEARERLAGERLRLRDFVLVMREDQVDAAGVDVERLAQVLDGHHGALDVPAGAARADRRLPERLAFLGRLPQREIARVGLLVLVHVHARAGQVAAEIVVRELAVPGKRGDAEIDRAVARVGVAGLRRAARWRATMSWMCSVAGTRRSGRSRRSAAQSSRKASV